MNCIRYMYIIYLGDHTNPKIGVIYPIQIKVRLRYVNHKPLPHADPGSFFYPPLTRSEGLECCTPPLTHRRIVIWVFVKIVVPFWIPISIRHLVLGVPQKGS